MIRPTSVTQDGFFEWKVQQYIGFEFKILMQSFHSFISVSHPRIRPRSLVRFYILITARVNDVHIDFSVPNISKLEYYYKLMSVAFSWDVRFMQRKIKYIKSDMNGKYIFTVSKEHVRKWNEIDEMENCIPIEICSRKNNTGSTK